MKQTPLNTPFKGLVKIGGKVYKCHVINGERYIDGKTVEEFMRYLTKMDLIPLAMVGLEALKREKDARKKN